MSAPRFDIQAKMPEGATEEQIPEMLQALLAERFGLKVHKSSKDTNVYALTVAKTGLKMKPAEAPPEAGPDDAPGGMKFSGNPTDGKGMTVNAGRNGGATHMTMNPDTKDMHMEFSKMPMTGFVQMLSVMVDRPVVDATDLKGDYQVALDLPMASMMRMAAAAGSGPPPGESNRMWKLPTRHFDF